ncbi:MAG: radical SAM family heme chaperone HemW [Mariprofundales bacterium]
MLLYIHIPFCTHKCPYCDFNSHVRRQPEWERYADALIAELHWHLAQPQWRDREISTVFFGGGTPSLAPVSLIARVMAAVRDALPWQADVEVSLEANPGSIDEAKLDGWQAAGINRLSIGVQSFDAASLHWLERIHSADQALNAVALAQGAGWQNIGLDLIYGLPDQAQGVWQQTLAQAMALRPTHLSCYQLTVEEGTLLAARHAAAPYPLPTETHAATLLLETRATLMQHGWQPYEVSNYARDGRVCRHNDGYWRYDDYLALGAGGCGKYDNADGGVVRYSNRRHPEGYMRQIAQGKGAVDGSEQRTLSQAAAEAVWLGLRRQNGVPISEFCARFGAMPQQMFPQLLAVWQERGMLELSEERCCLTSRGLLLADAVAADVLASVACV